MPRTHKLHHPPAPLRKASRHHVHYPVNRRRTSRVVLEGVALCAGIVAFGVLEMWLALLSLQELLNAF